MRVLVVEDDERIATAVRRGLQQEGYAVDVASSVTTALFCTLPNPASVAVIV